MSFSALARRETPIEKPVAGTGSAAEAGDEAVVAATATDGAEDDVLALLVLHLEGEFDLEDRAGVVFEAADDGGVDLDAVRNRQP